MLKRINWFFLCFFLFLAPKSFAEIGDSPISIEKVDKDKQATQIKISQKNTEFTLKTSETKQPKFFVYTNNDSVIEPTVKGNKLTIKGLKEGRASLRISEKSSKIDRYIGVKVTTSSGKDPGMPKYLSIGSVSEDTKEDLSFFQDFGKEAKKNKRADIRYIYMNGGPITGWRSTNQAVRATQFIRESKKLGMIPFFVFYNIPDNEENYEKDLQHIQDASYMEAYYKDLKFFLQESKKEADGELVGIILEPDFIGYMMQNASGSPKDIAAEASAAYSSGVLTKGKDPDFPNNLRGLVESINYIIKKNMPEAYYGWQFNLWALKGAPGNGIAHFTDKKNEGFKKGKSSIVAGAKKIAQYYLDAGVATQGAKFVSIDKYGLDATGAEPIAQTDPAASSWFWNADHWNNYLLLNKTIAKETKLPMILWQIPVGHINGSQAKNPYGKKSFPNAKQQEKSYEDSAPVFFLGDTFKPTHKAAASHFAENQWEDPKVIVKGKKITWKSHMKEAAEAGIISILFGAGVAVSTDGVGDPPTDGYWWIYKLQQYYKKPVSLKD